ncbi:MAG: KGGVGR-motif variant AAA ATPase [Bryobacteraceae bacterium]
MKCIAFYSYKGGVGRSLALANLSILLGHLKKRVFALDLDLEAPGLHYKYGVAPRPGVLECFTETLQKRTFPPSLAPYAAKTDLDLAGEVFLMTAGRAPSLHYWRELSRLNWHELFFGDSAPGIPFFLELKHRIAQEYRPDYLLIDSRTGITEIGGLATTILADVAVCLIANNRENLEGSREVLRGIRQAKRPPGAAPLQIIPVLSRLPFGEPGSEQALVETVLRTLNEHTEDLDTELAFAEVRVIHSWPELELRERVVSRSMEDEGSALFREYCQVFEAVLPKMPVFLRALVAEVGQTRGAHDPGRILLSLTSDSLIFGDLSIWREVVSASLKELAGPPWSRISELLDQALDLRKRQRFGEALTFVRQAIALSKERSIPNDCVQVIVADCLSLESWLLLATGSATQAVARAEEAVSLLRSLATELPIQVLKAYRHSLLTALNELGRTLRAMGRRGDAVAATQEALDLARAYAQESGDSGSSDLVRASNAHAITLSAVGMKVKALEAITEGVRICGELAAGQPGAFRPALAMSLNNQAMMLSDVGKSADALEAITEAMRIHGELASADPQRFAPGLARSLGTRGLILEVDYRWKDALYSYQEALVVLQPLAQAQPEAVGSLFGRMLADWARVGRQLGLALSEDPQTLLQQFLASIQEGDRDHTG